MGEAEKPGFTWTCPNCSRRVPTTVAVCRCGFQAPAAPPPSEPIRADTAVAVRRPTRAHVSITRDDLDQAVVDNTISAEQADRIWTMFDRRASVRPSFDLAHVAYYGGALLVIAAMGWLMGTAWDAVGGGGLLLLASVYALCFWLAGDSLWSKGLIVPGGLLFTLAVWMTPLGMYGLERVTGRWPDGDPGTYRGYYDWVKGSWFFMEAGTVAAGALAIRARRFPFLVAPIAFSLWFMSMDLAPLVFGDQALSARNREWVSLWFGAAMLLASYLADLRNRVGQDFAFWGYVFGLLAFWGGLSFLQGQNEPGWTLYALVNVGLIGLSLLLRQRAFIVFGAMGVMGFLGHLSYDIFENSLLFPVVLTFFGVFVMYLGVLYQRNAGRIAARLHDCLPDGVLTLIPPRARA